MSFVALWSNWALVAVGKCQQTFRAPISTGLASSALFVANFTSVYVQDHTLFEVVLSALGTEQFFAADVVDYSGYAQV